MSDDRWINDHIPLRASLEVLIKWHERRAKVKRTNAKAEPENSFNRGSLLGSADTHDVSAAVLRKVLDGPPVEDL